MGGSESKNERLKGTLTMNFGPKINVGGDLDYIYSRGYYKNNGNKLLSYRLFGSYKSDRYEAHAYLSNFNFINYENGGLANASVITNPDQYLYPYPVSFIHWNIRTTAAVSDRKQTRT